MGRTYTDFSQLSKGMFKKSEPVVEVKPVPKEASAGGDDALAYFGLTGREKREKGKGKREEGRERKDKNDKRLQGFRSLETGYGTVRDRVWDCSHVSGG